MSYAESLWLFLALLAGIILIPGVDMLFVLSNTLVGGRRTGLFATAGIMAGGALHTVFAFVAIGAVSGLAPQLFSAMVVIGAAYMAWIGITLMRSAITVGTIGDGRARTAATAFRQGLVTCLLNPKAYLFTLAVYPQFLSPRFGPLLPQAVVLGLMTVVMQFAVYGGLALAAAQARTALISSPRATILTGRLVGLLFIGVAILTLVQGLSAKG